MASNIRFLDQILINPINGGGETILNSSFISTGSITASVDVGTDTFKIQSGSSTFLYVSSSGNIGIGTTTPTNTLQVNGGITATSFTSSGAIINGNVTVTGTASINTLVVNQTQLSTGSNQLGDNIDDTQTLYGSVIIPTGSLTVTGSLNVTSGITGSLFGTSSWATNALTASFVNTASTNAFVQNGNSFGTTALLGTNDNQDLQFETNGSTRMTISSSGLIGINTTTPAFTLDINGSLRTTGGATVNSLTSVGNISSSAGIVIAGGANFDSAQVNNILIVGDGSDTTTAFAIIKNLYTSKEASATGKDMLLDSEVITDDNKKTIFKVIDNTTSVSSSIMTLTSEQRVGIGVDNPTAKFQVAGSTLISGSSTFSGSLSQQSIFTASFGYLIANSSLINGNSVISGSIELTGITSSVLTNDNLLIAGNVGQIENSGLTYNGTTLALGGANITSTGANSVLTGSFAGTFSGSIVVNQQDLTNGTGITSFTYDGNSPATVSVSGASALSTNAVTKWTGNAFANTTITDNGSIITTTTPLSVGGAITASIISASSGITGSLFGTASWAQSASNAINAQTASNIFPAITNNTDNRVLTATGGGTINGESNLTFDGTNLTVTGNAIITNNLTVQGTASFQQTTNLEVADRFILLASGSNSAGDGGIVVQQATQNVGEAFAWDNPSLRWGITGSFTANQSSYTPDAFMAAVVTAAGTTPSPATRYNAVGNIYVSSGDESIWIYS